MSDIRAVGYALKDQEDDSAFQMLVTDVQRLKQEVRKGSNSGAGGTTVATPGLVNADQLKGVTISTATPTNGQNLQYNSSTGLWTPATTSSAPILFAGDGDAASPRSGAVTKVGFTVSVNNIDTNSAFDYTNDQYVIPTTGYYFIFASAGFSDVAAAISGSLAIYKNGISQIAGSDGGSVGFFIYESSPSVGRAMSLVSGDLISLYTSIGNATGSTTMNAPNLNIMKLN